MNTSITRLVALFLIAAFAISVFTSCESDPGDLPEGLERVTNDAVDYYFYYPAGWTVDKNEGIISAYASMQDPSSISITAFTAPKDFESLEKYFTEDYEKYFTQNFSNINFTERSLETKIAEYPAYRCQFTSDIAGNSYKFMQILCVRGGYIYVVTYTSDIETYSDHFADIERAVSYIAFK